jgi:hypothetical protein
MSEGGPGTTGRALGVCHARNLYLRDMDHIATIVTTDAETGDEAVVVVRAALDQVALTLSLRSDGDVEVFLSADDARRVAAALSDGLRIATG